MGQNTTSSVDKPISETSSRCLTECVTAAHNFEVTRYSLLEGMGAGKFVSSCTFSVSGYDWNIRIYPDGSNEEDKVISAFLYSCGGTTEVKVKCTFSLLEKDGEVSNLLSDTHTFPPVGGGWGWPKFIEKSKLQELLSRNDDCFTIRCVLTVIKEPRTEDVSMVIVPQSDLHTHFANMLKDGEGVDVTFSVSDQLFSAHRYVLAARSSVFKAELFGEMKEATMKCIKIDDMEPAIFEALLHFIYTDSLPSNCLDDQNATLQHLWVAADRYGLDRLKAISEGKLCQRIDVETVATTLALAEEHQFVQLKSACLRYLSSQDVLRIVKKTDGFKHLAASCPSIVMDIFHTMCKNSTSRCFTECVTAAHNFEVNGYSLLQGVGTGKFVSSSKFTFSGYGWNISMYPDGWKEEDAGYMSTFLCFCSGTTDVKVKYSFSLLDKDGEVSSLQSMTRTFKQQEAGYYWGWGKFIEKSELQELLSRNDDCFTIRCVLTVIKETHTEDLSTAIVPVPESNLHTHFVSMFKHGEGADVTFSVGNKLFSAHRCVLAARSSVLKAELFGQTKRIKIDDMEPAIFEALLHFIYTDSLPGNCDVDQSALLQHLLVAADRYGLDRLKAICEGKLCQRIDVQTVATTLALAEQHHSVQLKSVCLRYLSSLDVLRAVKKTDGFKHLAESCPLIMMDILDRLSGV